MGIHRGILYNDAFRYTDTERCKIPQCSDSAFYDAALAADTVIYWEDIVKSFREVCRVLRNGGSFYIASELSDKGDAPEWILKSGYIHVRTPSELADMLEKAGFRSVEVLRANGPWMIIKAIKG